MMMSYQIIFKCCFLFWLAAVIRAEPREGFPFDEQLPTVARVDKSYSFQMSNETFISSDGDVTYSADDLPSWLSFDAGSRTLSGTPTSDDVTNNAYFTLTGYDNDGNLTKNYSIVVSSNDGPEPSTEYTVLSQLSDFGQTNGQNGLVLSPGEVFNVTFDSKTFNSDDSIKGYYGRSSDRSSLPNWLFFDSSSLKFSGVAPAVNSEIAPGFQYSFIFIATDYAGNAGSWVNFDIVVGYHDLTTSLKGTTNINGSAGDEISFELPLENVYEDGEEVSLTNISSVYLGGAPDWLSLDNYTLVGTVPENFASNSTDTFNVTLYDHYSNSVVLYFAIQNIESLFSVDSFRDANATRGSYFQYYFTQSQFTDFEKTNITVDLGDDAQDWLSFHLSNLTINGETPDDFDETEITVKATSITSDKSDKLSFKIYGSDSISNSTSSSSSSTSSSTHSSKSSSIATSSATDAVVSATDASSHGKSSKLGNNKALAIGLGVGIPLFLILVSLIIFFLCCFRRRKNGKSDEEGSNSDSPKISKPILGNPANGPNSRSPYSASSSQLSADGGIIDEKQNWGEPQRLGALNVLKLDGKDLYEKESNGSSLTKSGSFDSVIDDTHSSLYHDALQSHSTDMLMSGGHGLTGAAAVSAGAYGAHQYHQNKEAIPRKSWRQTIDSKINRESLNSLATVSTNELFSIRLAEDDDIKRDPRKSNLGFRDSAFLGSTASSILSRDDSGNIQRLDSDGNIVELSKGNNTSRHSKGTSLDVLKEEQSPFPPNKSSPFPNDTSFSTSGSSSTGEEFYPVETGNGMQWQQNRNSKFTFENGSLTNLTKGNNQTDGADGKKARLVDFTSKGRVDTSNDVSHSTYETAEIESL